MSFERQDTPDDPDQGVIDALHGSVLAALSQHFSGFGQAADAQREHARVRAEFEADPSGHLFGPDDAMRDALAAHPIALAWQSFERDAAKRASPYCVSLRFSE